MFTLRFTASNFIPSSQSPPGITIISVADMPRPARSPLEAVYSATRLLTSVLFVKAFFLSVGIFFISVALLGREESLRHYFPRLAAGCPGGDPRRLLLHLGLTLGAASAIAGLANCLALLGLRLWRRLLLLPYLACLTFGIGFSMFNILEVIFAVKYSNRGNRVSSNGSVYH
jgi:hypothetical protein